MRSVVSVRRLTRTLDVLLPQQATATWERKIRFEICAESPAGLFKIVYVIPASPAADQWTGRPM